MAKMNLKDYVEFLQKARKETCDEIRDLILTVMEDKKEKYGISIISVYVETSECTTFGDTEDERYISDINVAFDID